MMVVLEIRVSRLGKRGCFEPLAPSLMNFDEPGRGDCHEREQVLVWIGDGIGKAMVKVAIQFLVNDPMI